MTKMLRTAAGLIFVVVALASTSFETTANNKPLPPSNTNKQLPKEASQLVLSGSTTRRMFFFKVYKISHFMKATEGLPTQRNALVSHILNGRAPQRVELEFLRDVTPKQVEKALIDGIERNNENTDLTHIKKEIARLSYGFDDEIKKHSLLRLERHESSSLSVFFNNEFIVKTNNTELIHALWSIWFGHDPIVETEALISQLLSQ